MVAPWLLLLSLIVRVALLEPPAVGVNARLTAQLDPALSMPFATQVVPVGSIAKSPVSPSEIVTRAIVRFALPVFKTATDSTPLVLPTIWLPKATVGGETLASGADPVPVRLTTCGLFSALSAIVSSILSCLGGLARERGSALPLPVRPGNARNLVRYGYRNNVAVGSFL